MKMNWIKVSVDTAADGVEPLCGRLYDRGVTGVEIEDERDFEDFLRNNRAHWDYVDHNLAENIKGKSRVKFYLTDDEEGRETLAAVRRELDEIKRSRTRGVFGSLAVSLEKISEEDWANNWKQYFKPIKIGEKILVKPIWEETDNPEGRIVFETDPGMSFGSGQHETTRLCAEAIERFLKKGGSVLDIGCGSGILSIISLLLGAKNAVALDSDPMAVKIARQNARFNKIPDGQYAAVCADILGDAPLREKLAEEKFSVVAANIVADVIIPLADYVPDFMAEGGVFIASGIIEGRLDGVLDALEKNGLTRLDIRKENDWYCVVSKRRK